MTLEINIHTC